MAYIRANLVKETSTTTGTGTYALGGAVTDFRAFSAVCVNGDTLPYIARMGSEWEEGFGTWATGNNLARTHITGSSNAGAAVNWGAGTKTITLGEGAGNDRLQTAALASDYTNSTTTGTEVTGLSKTLGPGRYRFLYVLELQTAATATGASFGINFTGTATRMGAVMWYYGTGTSASTGIIDDASAGATDGLIEGFATRTETTTAPNLGPLTGVAVQNVPNLVFIEGSIVVTAVGDLELWEASEVATSNTTLLAGSSVEILKVA